MISNQESSNLRGFSSSSSSLEASHESLTASPCAFVSSSSLLASQSDFASPLAGIASTGFSTMGGEGDATGSGDLGRDSGAGDPSFATGPFFLRFP